MGWKDLIAAIVRLIEKFGGSIAAYFAGRSSQANKDRKASDQARIDELEERNEDLAEIDRKRSDPDELDRVRQRYRRKQKADD